MDERDILLRNLADILVQEMITQIKLAGHVMTGELAASVESRISQTVTSATIEILLNDYGIALDQGVPPENIPFTEPSGRGGTSLYIAGLQRFARLKLGIFDPRESLSVAFAIARKHKQTGMPVAGPSMFIDATLDATEADIETFITEWAATVFEAQLDVALGVAA